MAEPSENQPGPEGSQAQQGKETVKEEIEEVKETKTVQTIKKGRKDAAQFINIAPNDPVSYSFFVVMLVGGLIPNLFNIDMRFRKVGGINTSIKMHEFFEGGENLLSHKVPERLSFEPLKLERGMAFGSALNFEFNIAMTTMKMTPGMILVGLLDSKGLPSASWLFQKTIPLSWRVSELNADENNLVIDSLEFHYESYITLSV
ncbi:MAG: phage tail protein [Psychrosphaera sp.]|nr:phage tail protein [Psychrosphaera sp.]